MPEPVSTTLALVAGGALLTTLNCKNASVSESGEFLRQQAEYWQDYSRQPVSLDRARYAALQQLDEIIVEHSQDGWDGDKALALSPLTVQNVIAFLSALPHDIPDPDLTVEPDDGAISLEWYGGYRKIASVSIHESDRVAFAALQGTDISNGAYRIVEDRIPSVILTTIREIYS